MAFEMRTRPTGSDWNERPAPAPSTWSQRTPDWYYGPWIEDYYPWEEASFPWILENAGVDWNARLNVRWLYDEDLQTLLTEDNKIITLN